MIDLDASRGDLAAVYLDGEDISGRARSVQTEGDCIVIVADLLRDGQRVIEDEQIVSEVLTIDDPERLRICNVRSWREVSA
jgi:hypothetical protein